MPQLERIHNLLNVPVMTADVMDVGAEMHRLFFEGNASDVLDMSVDFQLLFWEGHDADVVDMGAEIQRLFLEGLTMDVPDMSIDFQRLFWEGHDADAMDVGAEMQRLFFHGSIVDEPSDERTYLYRHFREPLLSDSSSDEMDSEISDQSYKSNDSKSNERDEAMVFLFANVRFDSDQYPRPSSISPKKNDDQVASRLENAKKTLFYD